MRNATDSRDLTTSLKYLASGVSVAACLLLPTSTTTSAVGTQSRGLNGASTHTGDTPGEYSYAGTPDGLKSQLMSTARIPAVAASHPRDPDPPNLAAQLREISGLGVVPLHRIVGVSRQRFHIWLKQGGIGSDKIEHIQSLILAFQEIRAILGPDLKGFVKTKTRAGTIEDLLSCGKIDAVIGLALRPTPTPLTRDRSDTLHALTGLPRWLEAVEPLNWPRTDPGQPAYANALEDLAPYTVPEPATSPFSPSWKPRNVARIIYEA